MTTLSNWTTPSPRFGRSVNVERDADTAVISSYLPTARALDVVRRVGVALTDANATRALSVTGPYGSGKSSLAVFLDALLGPSDSDAYASALRVLADVDPDTHAVIVRARDAAGAGKAGFIRATANAEREPIVATAVRALATGLSRFPRTRGLAAVRREISAAAIELSDRSLPLPTPRFVREALLEVASHAPVLLMIDEFGKNLEAFADRRGEADLYFLQGVAEWSQGASAHPLVAMTLQHLAFEEYVDTASVAMRREWAKVQGRFEDIPFVDSAPQTRRLMSSVWRRSDDSDFAGRLATWTTRETAHARKAGVLPLLGGEELVAAGWPLHPVTQLVLPELCSRYGQNERTLFSFLASNEPLSVATWLRDAAPDKDLPAVGLGRVYDYFVDSASVSVQASQAATRWLEIETTIRDAVGLSEAHLRVLKVVGLLNLVSAGGSLRASKELISWAAMDGLPGTRTSREVSIVLGDLERSGRLTWRDFAAEYRLWRGSDLDLKSELNAARRQAKSENPATLLNRISSLPPAIAARHSIQTGTNRVFRHAWIDSTTKTVVPPAAHAAESGLLLYAVDGAIPRLAADLTAPKPVVVVAPSSPASLLAAAEEVSALRSLLQTSETVADDPVATRELVERESEAVHRFETALADLVAPSADSVEWYLVGSDDAEKLDRPATVSAGLSAVCDAVYSDTPPVHNELLNRFELSSQGAKARRELLEALLRRSGEEGLGIVGFGPERAMYDAILLSSGLHDCRDGRWGLAAPSNAQGWSAAWSLIAEQFELARGQRVNLAQVLDVLQAPPCGMTAGAAPVLLVAALMLHSGQVALYEHGSYRPRLTVDLCERLVRNPSHFEVKHFAAQRGPRRDAVDALAERLNVNGGERGQSVLSVVSHLAAAANSLEPYARQTRGISDVAVAFRRALLDAREPDVLLFDVLPEVLGLPAIPARLTNRFVAIDAYALEVKRVLEEISSAYGHLLVTIRDQVRASTAAPETEMRQHLAVRAQQLEGQVLDPRLRGLLSAFRVVEMDEREWLEYVAMTVAGPPPGSWTDEDVTRFRHSITELGGALRRLEAIQFEQRAADGATFEAVRLTVTRSDGTEYARVVATDAQTQATLSALVDRVIDDIDHAVGSGTRGVEAFVALLADRLIDAMSHPARTVQLTARAKAVQSQKEGESHG